MSPHKGQDEQTGGDRSSKGFQGMKTTDPEFIPSIKNLVADLSKHIKEEDGDPV
ncbi:hypothetical protein I7I51_00410 [Histoplasma capsulatum]|uniref:Uncharacterized protein n=1 Tax=Ajellomyces capsulatus TaxID=5037 RepID=A0A8A1MFM3_AJECA|nr:predicted protein [Histoplasma mississippiense (nom. inval.)]EDN08758.1 predicted protein [Histoplasma mississippiense (nom. inval.)]QSS63352.1 hypothetical protein I7I51_00410 [Histoplasma capsulatum]